jgi:hypothetical protein
MSVRRGRWGGGDEQGQGEVQREIQVSTQYDKPVYARVPHTGRGVRYPHPSLQGAQCIRMAWLTGKGARAAPAGALGFFGWFALMCCGSGASLPAPPPCTSCRISSFLDFFFVSFVRCVLACFLASFLPTCVTCRAQANSHLHATKTPHTHTVSILQGGASVYLRRQPRAASSWESVFGHPEVHIPAHPSSLYGTCTHRVDMAYLL